MPNLKRLDYSQVKQVLASKEARKIDEQLARAIKWPGEDNMKLLAEAVRERNTYVTFTDGTKFQIRYKSKYEAVFIKPIDGYVPCGYISYSRLKEYNNETV